MRALVVEDEAKIAEYLKRGLEAAEFTVLVAADGVEGLELARRADVDVVILDLRLPRMRGEDVLRALRREGSTVPVIVLTAKDAVADRVANLEAGADDYVVKPFSFAELIARIRLRVQGRDRGEATQLTVGPVTLDVLRREAHVRGGTVELTAREFTLLETFMRHPGQVLSQFQLLDLVWGYDFDPASNVVEVYVGRLRRKLGDSAIETVRGGGYRMRDR
jgi:DNA-binding response OmpR family regulator